MASASITCCFHPKRPIASRPRGSTRSTAGARKPAITRPFGWNSPEAFRSTIEDVGIDVSQLRAAAGPARLHVGGVEEERVAGFAFPQVLMRDLGNGLGAKPGTRILSSGRNASVPHERELAALLDDGTVVGRVEVRGGAVDDDAGNGELSRQRFTARFEVDGLRQALHV